jgi:hypothetical protein
VSDARQRRASGWLRMAAIAAALALALVTTGCEGTETGNPDLGTGGGGGVPPLGGNASDAGASSDGGVPSGGGDPDAGDPPRDDAGQGGNQDAGAADFDGGISDGDAGMP